MQALKQYTPYSAHKAWTWLSTLLINLMGLALPLVMLQVYDRVIPNAAFSTLSLLVFGAAAALFAEGVLRIVRSHMNAWIAARFEHQATCGAISRFLALPLKDFEKDGSGVHMDRVRAIGQLKDFYSGQTYLLLLDLPFACLFIVMMALIGGWMALIPIIGFVVFGGIAAYHARSQRKVLDDRHIADQRRTNFLIETLNGIHSVKAMAMEAMMGRRYERLQEASAAHMSRITGKMDLSVGISSLFTPVMTVAVVAYGTWLVLNGQMTNGALAACTLLALRSLSPLQRVNAIWSRLQQVRAAHEQLGDLFSRPGLEDKPGEKLGEVSGCIELMDVSYGFPGAAENIVDHVSLRVEPGECILIKGGNGSGRSTLLSLMLGIVKPDEGAVLLDGRNLDSIDPEDARKAIAYLPQKAQLFEGTIMDNLSAFDPDRVAEARRIAEQINLGDFVNRMRKGYDSVVGDAATDATPVGHRQRIAMVRALAAGPKVVLFDETNNSVDSGGEAAMKEYLDELKGKVTLVLITQRPSFQRMADRVFLLEHGKLTEDAGVTDFQGRPKVVPLHEVGVSQSDGTEKQTSEIPAAHPELDIDTSATDESSRLVQAVMRSFDRTTDLAVCLPVLLNALGWRGDSRDVAEALPYFAEELDITGLLNVLSQLDYQAHETPCRLNEIDSRLLPCLFLPEKGPALVLLEAGETGFVAVEGGDGGRTIIEPDKRKGQAFFFSRVASTTAPAENGASWVGGTFRRFRPLIAQTLVAALIFGIVLLPMPLFVMAVYEHVIPAGSFEALAYLTAGAALALVVSLLFVLNRSRALAYMSGRIEYLFGTTILRQILSLPASVSERAAVGAQVARIGSFEAIRDLFVGPIAATLMEAPAILVFVIAVGIINPAVLMVLGCAVIAFVLMAFIIYPMANQRVAEAARHSTQRNEFLIEMVQKMRSIREFGGERTWYDRFRVHSAEAAMSGYHANQLAATALGLGHMVVMSAGLVTLTVSVALAVEGVIGIGAVIASVILAWRILGPMQTIFTNITRVERIRTAIRQVDNLMAMKTERAGRPPEDAVRRIQGKISFARVSFRYSLNVDPAVLGVSFDVAPGEVVAITGPNGAGKSTLMRLVAGLYHPQAGSVRIDDIDIRQIDPVVLRRVIGYVPQECNLFHGTVAQNLRLVQPAATDAELWAALDKAGALEDIWAMERGLNTRVGDGASEQIPASLRQKLSLARLYLTQAPILLFDEPANALDFAGDDKFMDAIRDLKGKATIFFVTHRPSHLRLADRVMVCEGGYLRMTGTPDEVLRRLSSAA